MTEFDLALALLLGCAAFAAGFVDAVVGGGGLIQIPALLMALPNTSPATLFATNKLSSVVGTTSAAWQYARRIVIPWPVLWPAVVAALIGAWLGARAVAWFSPDMMRPLVLVLLIAVAVYTFRRKDLGQLASQPLCPNHGWVVSAAIGAVIGFYDGFFGPGTGSFLIFLFIRLLGMDFLAAAVCAKLVNVATNLGALSFFSLHVPVLWSLGATMALCNLAGALLGSRVALKYGSGFVRKMFLFVVGALILRLSWDVVKPWL